MAGNPSDVTNLLNEALMASNKIAASQLEAAKNINETQETVKQKTKKLSKTIKNTVDQLSLFKQEPTAKKSKQDSPTDKIFKTALDAILKANKQKELEQSKKTTSEKIKESKESISKVLITGSILNVRGNLFVNSKKFPIPSVDISKPSQSEQDYYRTDDTNSFLQEEIELLKSINEKLTTAGSGSESGLFGSLFGGIGNLAKMFVGGASAGVGGVAGGMFGLSKIGKLGRFLKPLQKLKGGFGVLKDASKLLTRPKLLVPVILAATGAAVYSSVSSGIFSKPLDEIGNAEQREKGGPVNFGKPYIVGEKGPELFTPRESGRIIPNNKLRSHNDGVSDSTKIYSSIISLVKDQNKATNNVFSYYTDNFEKVIDFFKPSNILTLIKMGVSKLLGNVLDLGKNALDTAKEAGTTAINFGASAVNSGITAANTGLKSVGLGNLLNIPLLPTSKEATPQPAPARRIGDKNVPKDMRVNLHKNEMVIPAAQSEMVRTAAKLQNQPMTTKTTPDYVSKNQLGKEFWMGEFVPQFAAMIKTRKTTDSVSSYSIGNIFGVE